MEFFYFQNISLHSKNNIKTNGTDPVLAITSDRNGG